MLGHAKCCTTEFSTSIDMQTGMVQPIPSAFHSDFLVHRKLQSMALLASAVDAFRVSTGLTTIGSPQAHSILSTPKPETNYSCTCRCKNVSTSTLPMLCRFFSFFAGPFDVTCLNVLHCGHIKDMFDFHSSGNVTKYLRLNKPSFALLVSGYKEAETALIKVLRSGPP